MTIPAAAFPPAPPTHPVAPQPAVSALPADATAGGLAFHRLVFARRRNGWWTPLVVGAVGLGFYLVLLVIAMIVVFIVAFNDPALLQKLTTLTAESALDLTDPFLLGFTLGSIVLMLPCYWLASLIINGRRVGLISSAAGRLRWRWLLLCGVVALVWSAVLTGLSLLIPGGDAGGTPPAENPQWLLSLVLVLLLVPVQAAAEEYVFRGYLMQAVGRWLRHPAFAILLPTPLFVFGHLYDVVGLTAVAVFAVAAGWLTWRTGGLEAAIALHVVNNLTAFLAQLAGGADATAADQSVASLLVAVLLVGGYVMLVEMLLRRRAGRGDALPRTLVLTPPPVVAAPVWPAPPTAGAWGQAADSSSASRIV